MFCKKKKKKKKKKKSKKREKAKTRWLEKGQAYVRMATSKFTRAHSGLTPVSLGTLVIRKNWKAVTDFLARIFKRQLFGVANTCDKSPVAEVWLSYTPGVATGSGGLCWE